MNNLANMFLSYLIDVCLVLPNLTKQTKNFLTKVQDHRSSEAITLPAVGNTILEEEDVL